MDLDLFGKRALVTGGSRGIGKAAAHELVREGCSVVVAARTEGPLLAAADEIRSDTGGDVFACCYDALDASSIRACVGTAVELLSGLDIVANCAARTGGHGEDADVYASASEEGMITDYTEKVVGSLRLARAAEPHLRAAGGGRIVLFSGGAGRVRGGLVSAGARNRALNNLMLTLANALGRYGIGVVCVAPGFTVTERQMEAHERAAQLARVPVETYLADRAEETTLLKRLVMAGDAAKVVTFLCSPVSWPINAAVIEVAGGSSPDIHYELAPHPPWQPGTAI